MILLNRTQDVEVWVSCEKCLHKTIHKVMVSVDLDTHFKDGNYEDFSIDAYQVIQCMGCRKISFRHTFESDGFTFPDEETGEETSYVHEKLFPPRILGRRKLPNWRSLPYGIQTLYAEVIAVLANNANRLAGVGIRSLIESVCTDRQAKGKGLQEKINDLVSQGVLTKDGADVLHRIRFLGNKAAHNSMIIKDNEVLAALDVAEHLISSVYLIPKTAASLPALSHNPSRGDSSGRGIGGS